MSCKHGYLDCKREDTEASDICFNKIGGEYAKVDIKKPKPLARRQQKADKRAGSEFEYRMHRLCKETVKDDVVTKMTINSGATVLEKGDEQMEGLVSSMLEYKTREVIQAPGKKTFTIHKLWLDKLHEEAEAANKEFHYLAFSFHKYDNDIYVIAELEDVQSMVKTVLSDRRRAKEAELRLEIAQKQIDMLKQELSLKYAELDYYEKNKELMDFIAEEK